MVDVNTFVRELIVSEIVILTLTYRENRMTGSALLAETNTLPDVIAALEGLRSWFGAVRRMEAGRVSVTPLDLPYKEEIAFESGVLQFKFESGDLERDLSWDSSTGDVTHEAAAAFDVNSHSWLRLLDLFDRWIDLIKTHGDL